MLSTKQENKKLTPALEYHCRSNKPGKIEIVATKPLLTQDDLSLAYSPGVAEPCLEIKKDVEQIYNYTAKGNMVAVISNGTAVLGLGNLGAAASKPVMEGKAVLFKKFADIDALDIEVNTEDPQEFIKLVKYLEYSWGGINLEDIKAPECFIIEKKLQETMNIPVFHDDQHGTAIVTLAGVINALDLTNRDFKNLKVVVNGAGAAGISCLELLKSQGVKNNHIILCDSKGVIYKGRKEGMNKWKEALAVDTKLRTLAEAIVGADLFLGLSAKDALTPAMVKTMAAQPIIFALANPDPEITPDKVKSVRSDAIIATGRSDYNNQVNNVMVFPYIFRGALDVRATKIDEAMKIAAAKEIAWLARQPVPDEVSRAYFGKKMYYGPDYILPLPFDSRLITTVPLAVAKAAIKTGIARKTDINFKQYKSELENRSDPISSYMKFIFEKNNISNKNIVIVEGEEEESVKAAILMRNNNYGNPILLGKKKKIENILKTISPTENLKNIRVEDISNCKKLSNDIDLLQHKGLLHKDCTKLLNNNYNMLAAVSMLLNKKADMVVTGSLTNHSNYLNNVFQIIKPKLDSIIFSYSVIISKEYNLIIANSINESPTPNDLVDIATQIANIAKNIGYQPKIILLSSLNFSNTSHENYIKVKKAVNILNQKPRNFECDTEIPINVALNSELLKKLYPTCSLSGAANILIMTESHTISVLTKLLQVIGGIKSIGPIIGGLKYPIQITEMNASKIVHAIGFGALETINNK